MISTGSQEESVYVAVVSCVVIVLAHIDGNLTL